MSDANTEAAVRRYLQWLTDPSSLRDEQVVARLTKELEGITDPIARLKQLSAIDRAGRVDGDEVKMGFIHHAKAWADANEVTVQAFRSFGVDDVMLEAAGLLARPRQRGALRPLAALPKATSGRAPNVGINVIIDHVRALTDSFTLADVMGAIGGSPATVRKAVEQLVSEGVVVVEGPRRDHDRRGRAPIGYRVVDTGA